jgi:hypothetical protein
LIIARHAFCPSQLLTVLFDKYSTLAHLNEFQGKKERMSMVKKELVEMRESGSNHAKSSIVQNKK